MSLWFFENEKFATRVLRGRAAKFADFLKIELIKIWLIDINVSIIKNRKKWKALHASGHTVIRRLAGGNPDTGGGGEDGNAACGLKAGTKEKQEKRICCWYSLGNRMQWNIQN